VNNPTVKAVESATAVIRSRRWGGKEEWEGEDVSQKNKRRVERDQGGGKWKGGRTCRYSRSVGLWVCRSVLALVCQSSVWLTCPGAGWLCMSRSSQPPSWPHATAASPSPRELVSRRLPKKRRSKEHSTARDRPPSSCFPMH